MAGKTVLLPAQGKQKPVQYKTQGMAGRGKRNVESDGRNGVCNRTRCPLCNLDWNPENKKPTRNRM